MRRITIPVFVLLFLQGTTDFALGAGGSEVVAQDQSIELAGNAMRIFFFAVGLVLASFAAAAAGSRSASASSIPPCTSSKKPRAAGRLGSA